ncbi:MAG: DUF309 domain-containing protein [Halobacteriota archaeon]|uniref:DUF309 domain-containing protein n=1 Tax=Natronomonas sp. TaxID=2184060 RepID=UPI0039765C11
MDRLRIGVALYNTGHYLAAHEPLEALWLDAPAGERDDCLQGVLQASVAIYKARNGNDAGAVGLAESAVGYLNNCGDLAVDDLAAWLDRLAVDPDLGRSERSPELRIDGVAIDVYDLAPDEVIIAGEAVAETASDSLLKNAVAYAESDFEDGEESTPFVGLTLEYLNDPRPVVRRRLRGHVERRRTRESDVEGLF